MKEDVRKGYNNITTIYSSRLTGFKWAVCNVYSPCEYNDKAIFWDNLEEIRQWWHGPVCIGCDLNAVRSEVGGNRVNGDSRNKSFLNEFIVKQELVDLPLVGGSYIWSNIHTNPLLCRLDSLF